MKYCLLLEQPSLRLKIPRTQPKQCSRLYLWRLYPFINDFIESKKSVVGPKVLSSIAVNVRM